MVMEMDFEIRYTIILVNIFFILVFMVGCSLARDIPVVKVFFTILTIIMSILNIICLIMAILTGSLVLPILGATFWIIAFILVQLDKKQNRQANKKKNFFLPSKEGLFFIFQYHPSLCLVFSYLFLLCIFSVLKPLRQGFYLQFFYLVIH